jgi:hypothetical protein
VIFVQLWGMIRYEMRLLWRRGGLAAAIALFAVSLFAVAAWSWIEYGPGAQLSPEAARARATLDVAYAPWVLGIRPVSVLWLALLPTVPPVVAEVIPMDRQAEVRELLDALPLRPGVYLLGKLLAVWVGILLGLAAAAALLGLAGWLVDGPFSLREYAAVWGIGVVPMALYVAGVSTLLAAGQPTRRRAAFVGGAVTVFSICAFLASPQTLWDAVNVTKPTVVRYLYWRYFVEIAPVAREWYSPAYSPTVIPLALGSAVLQMALVWLGAWLWRRQKEGR